MTTYSKRYPMNAGFRPGPIPTTWNYLNSYISSATWTAPDHGWYKIFAWGSSGNGVGGGSPTQQGGELYSGDGGRGGNSGGFSAHQFWCKKGTTIPISISSGIVFLPEQPAQGHPLSW